MGISFPRGGNLHISTEADIYFTKFMSKIMTTEITTLKKPTHCPITCDRTWWKMRKRNISTGMTGSRCCTAEMAQHCQSTILEWKNLKKRIFFVFYHHFKYVHFSMQKKRGGHYFSFWKYFGEEEEKQVSGQRLKNTIINPHLLMGVFLGHLPTLPPEQRGATEIPKSPPPPHNHISRASWAPI